MARKWEFSPTLQEGITVMRDLLNVEVEDLQGKYDTASDKWKESDKGQSIGVWIDQWQEILSQIDEADRSPEEA